MSTDRIPMGILAPKPKAEPKPAPTEQTLRTLIANDGTDIALQYIDQFKMPYKIENGELKDLLKGTDLWIRKFITVDPDTLNMIEDVKKLAKAPDEVLITGETGTGKETLARALIGDRKGQVIAVNCGGLPEHLIESELFGHVRGAFTGAETTKKGLMQEAEDGVLFLDEVGELPLHTQAKLLRALQEHQIRKVGGNTFEDINCKFVCATHRNIKQMVKDGKFREDLYARISTFEVHIKPLRERECDIIPIILSIKGGKEFMEAMTTSKVSILKLNLSLNVRSLHQYIRRHAVYGRLTVV